MDLVSAVIPTFNRFKFLLNAIQSIKLQTYSNIEIVVVNDCSTEREYYEYNWKENNINIIHLEKNSKELFGYVSAGHVRNEGIKKSSGKFIAFCDDDDIWFPNKIELQLNAMKKTGCKMSCTEGLFGAGIYDSNKLYKKYNAEQCFNYIKNMYKSKRSNLFDNGFPEIWDINFININNCIICSSVLMEKEILDIIDNMKCLKNGQEDYDCWLRTLKYTNCVYVQDICFYYDSYHGNGQNY